jgi:hypothetical protein
MKKRGIERIRGWARQLSSRVKEDGARDVWHWAYGHGVPTVVGVPIVKYHKIMEGVYVGPQHGKLGHRRLAAAGVTASLNMRTGYSDVDNGVGFGEYLQLPTTDGTPPSLEQLREGAEFIRRVVAGGGSVYIHCQTGLGRGPTMAAAYLISEGRSLEEACEMIRTVRPFTDIRPGQLERLQEFERAMS